MPCEDQKKTSKNKYNLLAYNLPYLEGKKVVDEMGESENDPYAQMPETKEHNQADYVSQVSASERLKQDDYARRAHAHRKKEEKW